MTGHATESYRREKREERREKREERERERERERDRERTIWFHFLNLDTF